MYMLFTEKLIKSLKTKPERYDLREQSGEGFAVRVSPSGEKSWVFIYFFEGRKRRMTLGNHPHLSLAEARRLHREALKILHSGKDPADQKRLMEAEARDSFTVTALINEYMDKWAKPRKRSWQADERCLNKDVKPYWGKRKAREITRRDVILLLDRIKDRGAPIQANRTLACVRRMFNFALERDIIESTPCTAVKMLAKENRKDRVLSVEEIKNFWNGLHVPDKIAADKKIIHQIRISESAKLALKLQLVTAQRKGEIIGAEWNEIDLNAAIWTIPATKAKNGNMHRVPLSTLALKLLTEIKTLNANDRESRWLFPSPKNNKPIRGESIDHAIRRCTFKDVQSFTPHDLRRTAGSRMTAMGISRLIVSKLLNHVENSVTAIYDRYGYDTEKKNALELWGKNLHEIINNTESASNIIKLKNVV